jgi:hypothetical protein
LVDFSTINQGCLSAFGQPFSFTPQTTGIAQSITGILDSGVELEDVAPGDGSTYARLWIDPSALAPSPQQGDEIASATTVYKIVKMQEDAGGGLWMLLRYDRAVS